MHLFVEKLHQQQFKVTFSYLLTVEKSILFMKKRWIDECL